MKNLSLQARIAKVLFLSIFSTLCLFAQPGANDPSFNTNDYGFNSGAGGIDNDVYCSLLQPDGKIIIAGNFTTYNGTAVPRIARLNADGSLDQSFNAGTGCDGIVYQMALQSDGKIVLVGNFSFYNGNARSFITRINANGSIDNSFTVGLGTNTTVYSVAIQSDGKIVIGGAFSTYAGNIVSRLARINSNGSFDNTFNPGTGTNTKINNLSIQPDGKIVIVGDFTDYNGTGRNYIARVNSNGTIDASFNPGLGANTSIFGLALQPDGKIVIGGNFNTYNGVTRNRIARLNSDGSYDSSFNIGTAANSLVQTINLQSDGKIIIGGNFTAFNGSSRTRIARLNTDGTVDASFTPSSGLNLIVNTILVQSDGKIFVGGDFTTINGSVRVRIARFNTDGSLDSFNGLTGANNIVRSVAVQTDGKIIIAGDFTYYNEAPRNRITRVNADGTNDASFTIGTGANNSINNVVIQTDGKIIITGAFTNYNGTAINMIARLNSNGTLDAGFNPGTGVPNINTVIVQPDGKILVCGVFSSAGGSTSNNIARLNSDGTPDLSLNATVGANSGVRDMALQPDGKIILVGNFTSYNSVTRNYLVRINSDGSLDNTFNPSLGANNFITKCALQSDGKIIIGGNFTQYNGVGRNYTARVNSDGSLDMSFNTNTGIPPASTTSSFTIQPDGKVIISGNFTTFNGSTVNNIVRIDANGNFDSSFLPGLGADGQIYSTALQADGRLVIGGSFISYNNIGRNRVARVLNSFAAAVPNDSTDLEDLRNALGGWTTGAPTAWNSALPVANQWSPNNPITNWYGVTTVPGPSGPRVVSIDLGNFANPTGPTGGQVLINNVCCPLFYAMDSLRILRLDSSGLSGQFVGQFFGNGGVFPNMREIDISGNSFTYTSNFFSNILGGTSTVEILKARGCFNVTSVTGGPNLPLTILSNLRVLDIGRNNFSGGAPDLSQGPLAQLIEVYYDFNRFNDISINSLHVNLRKITISQNQLTNITPIYDLLRYTSNLEIFEASKVMDTMASNYIFAPSIAMPSTFDKIIDLSSNRFDGVLDLNYFGDASNTRILNLNNNELDSVIIPAIGLPDLVDLKLSNNQIVQRLTTSFLDNIPNIEELHLNNNRFYGVIPTPANGQKFRWTKLRYLYLNDNNLVGPIRLDWVLNTQVDSFNISGRPASIEKLHFFNNRFNEVVVPSQAVFNALKYVTVQGNRLDFKQLHEAAIGLGMAKVMVPRVPAPIAQYTPNYWLVQGSTFDTLNTFLYTPQDSAGIGGIRRRPHGDSVIFASPIGAPPMTFNKTVWIRDSSGIVQTMGTVSPNATTGAITINGMGIIVNNTAGGTTMAPNSNPQMMAISNLDSNSHHRWLINGYAQHDSFPLLTIPMRKKRMIVGKCVDNLGQNILCQQFIVQFRDTVSDQSKERIRTELGITILDSCVCGSIELWGMPDTLNQATVEFFGSGTRSTAGTTGTKPELLSADPNYFLLGDTTGLPMIAPSFTVGSTHSKPTLVAIIDSGTDFDNPKLKNRIWVNSADANNNGIDDDQDCLVDNGWGYNFVDRNNSSYDDHGHGTAVATIIGGYSSVNPAPNNGITDNLAIIPYKYTNSSGAGTVFNAACAVRHAADYKDVTTNGDTVKVRVINASWGYYGEACMVLENAIIYSGEQCGILFVASAGNDAKNTQNNWHWPSNSPAGIGTVPNMPDNVLSVAAHHPNNPDILATYSNKSNIFIDMVANGYTLAYRPGNDTAMIPFNGTSFASAQVARAAGLLFHEFPDASFGAVKYALMHGVDTLNSVDKNEIVSQGRLNLSKARNVLANILNRSDCNNDNFVVSISPLRADETAFARVFPNPARHLLNLDFESLEQEMEVKLFAADGRLIYQNKMPIGSSSLQISLEELPTGLFMLQLRKGVQTQHHKLIKY